MSSRKEFFNTAAVTWDERFQNQELADFLCQLIPTLQLKQGQRVLDVGTGTGILVPFLLKAVGLTGQVTAIDFAEKMVKVCKAKYANLPNVTVLLQQVENLEFHSETFDAVTCFGLFPHLENKKEALDQINRVLRTGGKLMIAHALSSVEIRAHHRYSSAVVNDVLPDELEMKRLLKQAGFTGIQIADEPGSYVCLSTKPPTY